MKKERSCDPCALRPPSLLSLQLAQQSLGSYEMVVENPPGDAEQFADQWVTDDVSNARAFLAARHDVLRPQDCELLGDNGLIDVENFL